MALGLCGHLFVIGMKLVGWYGGCETMIRKVLPRGTCNQTDRHTDGRCVYYYNDAEFESASAESEVVHWPLTKDLTRRKAIAKCLFETFYPVYMICKMPDGKLVSCGLSYTVESRGEHVEKYTLSVETGENFPDDWLHNTMELGERFNEDVLEVFEEWFENTALPAIMEKGGGERYTMAATS